MGVWNIGFVQGQYQPEDFTETQVVNWDEQPMVGSVSILQAKGWARRELTISFMVDDLCSTPSGVAKTDPETVFFALVSMARPPGATEPEPVLVTIPGWPGRSAFITKVSMKRTSIEGKASLAARATITVTIKEAVGTNIGAGSGELGGGGGGSGRPRGGGLGAGGLRGATAAPSNI